MGLFSDHKAKKEAENMGAMGAGHCCGGHDGHGMASNMGDSAANVAKDPVCGMSVDPPPRPRPANTAASPTTSATPVAPTSSPRTRPPHLG